MSVADFQAPELWENQHLLFKQPVLGILLWQPEKTNIPLHPPPLLEPKRDFLLRGKKTKTKTILHHDETNTVSSLPDHL